MTTNNSASGNATGLHHGTIPAHIRANHDNTDALIIRIEGLIAALDIVADEIPKGEVGSGPHWTAFYALTNQIADMGRDIHKLRTIEWVGFGGSAPGYMTEAEIAKARGIDALPKAMT